MESLAWLIDVYIHSSSELAMPSIFRILGEYGIGNQKPNYPSSTGDGPPSRIATVDKMEGGLSKALLMKKENGREVIAKIPCRIAGPARLTTASEVGVLQYGMSMSIPFLPLVFRAEITTSSTE